MTSGNITHTQSVRKSRAALLNETTPRMPHEESLGTPLECSLEAPYTLSTKLGLPPRTTASAQARG